MENFEEFEYKGQKVERFNGTWHLLEIRNCHYLPGSYNQTSQARPPRSEASSSSSNSHPLVQRTRMRMKFPYPSSCQQDFFLCHSRPGLNLQRRCCMEISTGFHKTVDIGKKNQIIGSEKITRISEIKIRTKLLYIFNNLS